MSDVGLQCLQSLAVWSAQAASDVRRPAPWNSSAFFAPDQAVVSERGKKILAEVVEMWNAFRTEGRAFCGTLIGPHPVSELPRLEIIVYAWEDGSKQWNFALSEHRAHAVADELIALGMNKSYLTVVAFGDTKPRIVEAAQDEPQNLRVELIFRTPP